MNNSIKRKIEQNQKFINPQTELSSTSSDFILNYNKKSIKQKGGNKCSCKKMFKSIDNKNLELILYILEEKTCCFMCEDSEGNTILHLLIPFYEENKEIANVIDDILLNENCSQFINIQNNLGETPMLLAVMNDLNELAEKMENAGANPSIADNEGNLIRSETNDNDNDNNETDAIPESKIKQNIMNIFNFVMPKREENNLTSLNLSNDEDESNNDTNFANLDTDNFMENIKSKINSSINNKDNSSSSSSEYETFPKFDSIQNTTSDTLGTDKFLSLLGKDNKPLGVVKYTASETDDNTDQFIATLKNKWNSISETDRQTKNFKPKSKMINSDTLGSILNSSVDETSFKHNQIMSDASSPSINMSNDKINKLVNEPTSDEQLNQSKQLASETSLNTIDTDVNKYLNEITSDAQPVQADETKQNNSKSKYNIFLKENKEVSSDEYNSTDIDTNTLLNVIKKIQTNNVIESDELVGGGMSNKKQKIMGYRNLKSSKKPIELSLSDDYNQLYNSDSEAGKKMSKNNELSRMMISQKEKAHKEVLEMIMRMLNSGLLTQSNKPIEATERNAKLIKAYIYRQISEKNPQMGGMDKILTFKTMSETEIINMVKKMPELDELEKSIQKHLEDKQSSKKTNLKSIDVSDTSEAEASEVKEKKSSKKSSKK